MAFAGGFLAIKLRLPPLVGYLAGRRRDRARSRPASSATRSWPSQLAEIGVILLMFGVGLHFSIRDLMAVRKIAIPGALGQIAVATVLGIAIALLWGWSFGAGLVFGLALSVASTVVLLRALEERGALDSGPRPHRRRLADRRGPGHGPGPGPAAGAGRPPGRRQPRSRRPDRRRQPAGRPWPSPWARSPCSWRWSSSSAGGSCPGCWRRSRGPGSRELFTLSVLATALGIAYGSAELFGVSFALGAFFAGVVLSETDFSHQAAADPCPCRTPSPSCSSSRSACCSTRRSCSASRWRC